MIDLEDFLPRLERIRRRLLISRYEMCDLIGISFITFWRIRRMYIKRKPIKMAARTANKICTFVYNQEGNHEKFRTAR